MNTRCSVCHHPQRAEIEAAHIAGGSFREIGKRFDRSKTTIAKHIREHVPESARKALDASADRDVEAGTSVLDELRALSDRASSLLAQAEESKDGRLSIAALRELARHIELRARLLGELRDREITITNVQVDPATLSRMAEMYLQRAKLPNADLPAAIAAPSTVTLDVAADCVSRAAGSAPASRTESA